MVTIGFGRGEVTRPLHGTNCDSRPSRIRKEVVGSKNAYILTYIIYLGLKKNQNGVWKIVTNPT